MATTIDAAALPIEPATDDDGPWIKRLLQHDGNVFQGAMPWWRRMNEPQQDNHTWVVIRPYAFMHYHVRKRDGVHYVDEIAVDPSARRMGLGRRLLEHAGTPLELKTNAADAASNPFYHAFGMRVAQQVQTRPNKQGTTKTLNVYRLDATVNDPLVDDVEDSNRGAPYRNRIVGYADMDPRVMDPHPLNPRTHSDFQLASLDGVMASLGVIQNVVWNRTTNHIIDGHARRILALERHEPSVPTTIVEMSAEEEALAIATFDPLGTLAEVDKQAYSELLQQAQVDDERVRALLDDIAAREQVFSLSGGALSLLDDAHDGMLRDEAPSTTVAFKFGEISGQVEHDVYALFTARYRASLDTAVALSDVLRDWLASNGDDQAPMPDGDA